MKHNPNSDRLRKTAIMLPAVAALLFGATSCTTNTWQKNQEICTHRKDDPTKFGPEGHMSTTYVVARIAGNDEKTSLRLSHFSQAPDDLAFLYSAPAVAVWGSFQPGWGYRHRIVNVLHSLHGGDTYAVNKRRENLKKLISEMSSSGADDWKTGFLIHAYGDSYAHVKGPPDQQVAYGVLVGHGFDHSVKPDHIEHHVENYGKYVENLYATLATGKGDPNELQRFIQGVKSAAGGPDAETKVGQAIVCFKFKKDALLEFELQDIPKRTRDWNSEIKFRQVDSFLREAERRL